MTPDKYFMDFVAEALIMNHKLATELEKIASGDFTSENVYEAYRMAHSLNSSSQMAGLPILGNIASLMESSLETFVEEPDTTWPEGLLEILAQTNSVVGKILDEINTGKTPNYDMEFENVQEIWSGLEQTEEAPREAELASVVEDFFLIEAEEHLKTMTDGLLSLEKNPEDKSTIDSVFRAAHTLKGAASSVGFKATEVASHALEDVLEQIREGEIALDSQKTDVLLGSLDALKETLQLETSNDKSAGKVARQMVDLVSSIGASVEKTPAKTQVYFPSDEKKITREPDVRVRLSKLDHLMNLTGEFLVQRSRLDESRTRFIDIADQMRIAIRRFSALTTDLSQQRLLQRTDEAMRNRVGVKPGNGGSGSRFASEFDELEFDRYGELDRILRNQTEVHADMVEMLARFEDEIDELGTSTSRLIQNVTSIQDSVIGSRLISISQVLDRFPRMVRDLARNENKQVNLIIEGETVEIDVKIADRIYDPLLHIIRNAVHHGIESSKERASLGKPVEGTIVLSAEYKGNQVILRIANDGAPLDTNRIADAAVELGLATKAELEDMTEAQINRFIFKSGLSTAEDKGMVAGRGVGLDVVRTIIEEIGGQIDVESTPESTEFILRLPISLVISQGLVIDCQDTPYVIPLGQVSEVLNIPKSQIKMVGQTTMYQLREELVQVHFLDEILGVGEEIAKSEIIPSVLVEFGTQRVLISVSGIPGKHDMVIKSMPKMLSRLDMFAGATIFGSGQVVLVLNPGNLVETKLAQARITQKKEKTSPTNGQTKRILVVDDSLSMRKILQLDLNDAGFVAKTAASGLEALDVIEKEEFDLLVLDIEMPEMDGFELMSILKDDPRFFNIPNMIITSRSGQKHRTKAFELGANAYLVKPYDQQLFLETVKKLLESGGGSAS